MVMATAGLERMGRDLYDDRLAVPGRGANHPRDSMTRGAGGRATMNDRVLGKDGAFALPAGYAKLAKTGGPQRGASGRSNVGYNREHGYPFVDWESFKNTWYKMIAHSFLKEVFSLYNTPPEDRNSLPEKIIGCIFDAEKRKYTQMLRTEVSQSFPKIVVWGNFADSPSLVEEMYTVEWGNKEIPIHFRTESGGAVSDDALSDAIRFVRDERTTRYNKHQSPYNYDRDEYNVTRFHDEKFSDLAADKFTRGDYGTFVDPGTFNPWFVRDDTWMIQQYGTNIDERTLTVDGTSYTIRGYRRPNKLSMWWYWAVGDKVYDIIDVWFDPIQKVADRIFSKDAQQELVRQEYKMIAGIRRSLFDNPGRIDLAYEV
ncbi:MAG: hypothetical protein DRO99_04210 [Candidatus Aenigmatarchaeota archaeon]|nr:MAG: hypothetical protein DRO99_04210 [Candidatus Aenigmarchaeota archaeon]